MTGFSESTVEDAALAWLEAIGGDSIGRTALDQDEAVAVMLEK